RIQGRAAIPFRPSSAEDGLGRAQMNIGVDQGSATESGGLHHRHLLKRFDVEQALPGFPEPSIEGVIPVAGELMDVVPAPSCEYRDPRAGLREPASSHRSSKPGSNYNGIVGGSHSLRRRSNRLSSPKRSRAPRLATASLSFTRSKSKT